MGSAAMICGLGEFFFFAVVLEAKMGRRESNAPFRQRRCGESPMCGECVCGAVGGGVAVVA